MNVLILEDNEVARNALVKIVKSCMNQIQVFAFANRGEAYFSLAWRELCSDRCIVMIILKSRLTRHGSGAAFLKPSMPLCRSAK